MADPVVEQVEPDPTRPYAAYVSAFLTIVGYVLAAWLTDGTPRRHPEFTMDEFKAALGSAVILSGIVGGGTFATKKPLRRKPAAGVRHDAALVIQVPDEQLDEIARRLRRTPEIDRGVRGEGGYMSTRALATAALVIAAVLLFLFVVLPALTRG